MIVRHGFKSSMTLLTVGPVDIEAVSIGLETQGLALARVSGSGYRLQVFPVPEEIGV